MNSTLKRFSTFFFLNKIIVKQLTSISPSKKYDEKIKIECVKYNLNFF